MSIDIGKEMNAILTGYSMRIVKACDEVVKEESEKTTKVLKSRSPRDSNRKPFRVGKRRYASGWRAEKEERDGVHNRYIIYNKNEPTLTHLLENGHVVKNQYGTYGRTRAIPHIGNSANEASRRLVKKVERIIQEESAR